MRISDWSSDVCSSDLRDYYGRLVAPLRGKTDLVLLPETFTSGFSNEAIDPAETMQGPTVDWLREQSLRLGAAITGRSEERRGGKECVSTCRSRWSRYH